jgi:hypothetical protein
MIWHIFKKDVRLLWPLVAGVASVHFALATVLFKLGHFGGIPALNRIVDPLMIIGMLGTGFLIAAVVHQDAIPGVRQDWLVRPVKRRDLLLAKLLFVLLMVQGPILAADFLHALASGFPLSESFGTAISRSGYILLGFSLPLLAFASLTRNFMEAIVGGVAVFTGFGAFMMLFQRGRPLFVATGTGVQWVSESTWFTITLLGVALVLALQYFRRRTMQARWLMGTAILLCLCTAFIPWQAAFAIQQQRSPSLGSSGAVVVAFEHVQGKLHRPGGLNTYQPGPRSRIGEGDVFVYLPLRIAGLPDGTVLRADHAEVRLISPDRGAKSIEPFDNLEVRKEGHSESEKRTYYGIRVPGDIYALVIDQPIRIEVDYSLTLFSLAASHALPALNGEQRMPDLGWCATKVNFSGTTVNLRCLQAGKAPSCSTLFLEHPPSGRRNPAISACSPDYSPYLRRSLPDAMGRFGRNLPFRDPSGLAQYPVDGPQLAESQVVVRTYQPLDHFTRRVDIPEIRLKDWESGLGF